MQGVDSHFKVMKVGYRLICLCLSTSTSSRSFLAAGFYPTTSSAFASARNHKSSPSQRTMSTEVTPGPSPGTDDASMSWRSLIDISIAKSRKIRGSNYVQLATVDSEGEPRCRTVVFRGFQSLDQDHPLSMSSSLDGKSCLLKMCTDLRSQKVQETKQQSTAEIVWWFPKSSEQYRIRGTLLLVGNANNNENSDDDKTLLIARKELWGNISDPARESFLGTAVPGAPYAPDTTTSSIPTGGRDPETGKPVPPPANFLLMLLKPTSCDYLRLVGDQYRQIDTLNGEQQWSYQRVNP